MNVLLSMMKEQHCQLFFPFFFDQQIPQQWGRQLALLFLSLCFLQLVVVNVGFSIAYVCMWMCLHTNLCSHKVLYELTSAFLMCLLVLLYQIKQHIPCLRPRCSLLCCTQRLPHKIFIYKKLERNCSWISDLFGQEHKHHKGSCALHLLCELGSAVNSSDRAQV